MNCIKFKDCQNAIYPHKCKSCGSGMLNFVNKKMDLHDCGESIPCSSYLNGKYLETSDKYCDGCYSECMQNKK